MEKPEGNLAHRSIFVYQWNWFIVLIRCMHELDPLFICLDRCRQVLPHLRFVFRIGLDQGELHFLDYIFKNKIKTCIVIILDNIGDQPCVKPDDFTIIPAELIHQGLGIG